MSERDQVVEEAMMICSCCANAKWFTGTLEAKEALGASDEAQRLARLASINARWRYGYYSYRERYAEAEAMIACGWRP